MGLNGGERGANGAGRQCRIGVNVAGCRGVERWPRDAETRSNASTRCRMLSNGGNQISFGRRKRLIRALKEEQSEGKLLLSTWPPKVLVKHPGSFVVNELGQAVPCSAARRRVVPPLSTTPFTSPPILFLSVRAPNRPPLCPFSFHYCVFELRRRNLRQLTRTALVVPTLFQKGMT